MSVKRYRMQESDYGPYVQYTQFFKLENDYTALLARHNALREAVAWERECWEIIPTCEAASFEAEKSYYAARAEVDRLMEESC